MDRNGRCLGALCTYIYNYVIEERVLAEREHHCTAVRNIMYGSCSGDNRNSTVLEYGLPNQKSI